MNLNSSVVICFYNEEFHTLIRTVHSVLDQTPVELLHEILLVDDNSDAGKSVVVLSFQLIHVTTFHKFITGNLHHEVEEYVTKNFPLKVQLLNTGKREGLIRARIFGAKKATGQVKFNNCKPKLLRKFNFL